MEIADYFTVPEAAGKLSVGVSAVHNAIAEGRLPVSMIYGRKLIRRANLDAYKQRTRPDGEKPKGRPKKLELRNFEYQGRVVHLSRAPVSAGFVSTTSRMYAFHSIRIDGVDDTSVKEMTIELDETVSLDELEQLAKDYIDGFTAVFLDKGDDGGRFDTDQDKFVVALAPDSPRSSKFYVMVENFLIKLESLEESVLTTIPAIAEAHEKQLEEHHKRLRDFLASAKLTNQSEIEQFIKERSLDISRLTRMVKKSSLAPPPTTILNSLYIYIFSLYDALLNDLMHLVISHKPHLVNEKPLNLGEIINFGSIDKAKEHLIDKEVERFIRKSYTEQFDYLEGKLEMPLRKNLTAWPSFVEASQRRHLFVHASGRVSQQYIDECTAAGYKWADGTPSVGDSLQLTIDDVRRASALCYELGFKLAQTLYRKTVPSDLNIADSSLNDHMYGLNVSEQWDKSILVGEFAMGMPVTAISKDNMYRSILINLAQAYKWSGNNVKAQALIDKKDWSSCGDNFHLVLAVLKDNYVLAAHYMKTIGSSSHLDKGDYLDWPIFREFRKQKEFLDAYELVFGEPFAKSVLQIAEGENTVLNNRVTFDLSSILPPSFQEPRN